MQRISSSGRSTRRVRRVVVQGLGLATVIAVTMLGNLRLQASEVDGSLVPAAPDVSLASVSHERSDVNVRTEAMRDVEGGDVDSDVQLVPAIYAWNPDVRFVYFRHVSKWM